ncbi:MAG: glycyl-radical enzyme activating protein [Vallitaleaceae bacterium]|jgi:pyruvate formate lyase activating enzyme|nr:glycyl-radical enzyme activating protein [Vallitaleaceae bacterium]
MEESLLVIDIERFAIHDGPGIRTTVFLQGCPLHCLWCSNPESQHIKSRLLFNESKCIGCGKCYDACDYNAIEFANNRPEFFREKCVGCRRCEEACPTSAIHFSSKKMSPQEVLDIVLRDKDYFERTSGGITISGGEAFVQFEGFYELLKISKLAGIHTAVETCGEYDISLIEKTLPYLDLFLFDLKHVDGNKLKEFTGGNLDIILGNIQYIAKNAPEKLQVRVPIIPGFNHNEDAIKQIFNKALDIGVKSIMLLPYHTLGMDKYKQLDRKYPLECKKSLSKNILERYIGLGKTLGIDVRIS